MFGDWEEIKTILRKFNLNLRTIFYTYIKEILKKFTILWNSIKILNNFLKILHLCEGPRYFWKTYGSSGTISKRMRRNGEKKIGKINKNFKCFEKIVDEIP